MTLVQGDALNSCVRRKQGRLKNGKIKDEKGENIREMRRII
jgi:hypothetical protein